MTTNKILDVAYLDKQIGLYKQTVTRKLRPLSNFKVSALSSYKKMCVYRKKHNMPFLTTTEYYNVLLQDVDTGTNITYNKSEIVNGYKDNVMTTVSNINEYVVGTITNITKIYTKYDGINYIDFEVKVDNEFIVVRYKFDEAVNIV